MSTNAHHPEAFASRNAVETGWVLERSDSTPAAPVYYSPHPHGEQWTSQPDFALRFVRQQDAAQLGAALGIAVRVCEHQWG